jgi:hypothetical protein
MLGAKAMEASRSGTKMVRKEARPETRHQGACVRLLAAHHYKTALMDMTI